MSARRDPAATALFVASLLVLAGYASAWRPAGAPTWGVVSMVAGCTLMIVAATAFGAARSGVRPPVVRALTLFLLTVVGGAFGAVLLIHRDPPWLVLGLPLRAAIEVYGVAIAPVLVVPVVFAATFRRGR